jgi:hypothetical protein
MEFSHGFLFWQIKKEEFQSGKKSTRSEKPLVASVEARPGPARQHPQMLAWSDHTRPKPVPALAGRSRIPGI